MTPKFGCGYFFVNPEYKFTNKKKNKYVKIKYNDKYIIYFVFRKWRKHKNME